MDMTTSRPRPVLGAMDFGTRIDAARAFAILDRFVARGGVWIDTANCYSFWNDPSGVGGASERVLGAWLRANPGIRDHVKIATKVRQNPLVPHAWPESAEGLSAQAIRDGVAGSLDRLGIDDVDLLWAHAEDHEVDLAETVAAFGELVAQGIAGRVGAANHAAWRVERARRLATDLGVEPWSALQLRHSLAQPRPGTVVPEAGHRMLTADDLALARTEQLTVWCYSPLLFGAYSRDDRPFSEAYDHPGTDRVRAVLADVAREVGATANQVVLAWLMRQGIAPLTGMSRPAYVDEAMDAAGVVLSDDHMARFEAAR